MSFSIQAAGTVEQVRAQVQAAGCYGDRSQFDKVREFIVSEVDAWPSSGLAGKDLGLVVEASGHHDGNTRGVNMTLRAIYLPKTESADET